MTTMKTSSTRYKHSPGGSGIPSDVEKRAHVLPMVYSTVSFAISAFFVFFSLWKMLVGLDLWVALIATVVCVAFAYIIVLVSYKILKKRF